MLTPELQKAFVAIVARGHYNQTACDASGITTETYRNWMARGEAGEAPYLGFFEAVKKARSAAEVSALSVIERAASGGQWQAAAWWMERRYPDKWGKRPPREKPEKAKGVEDFHLDLSPEEETPGEDTDGARDPGLGEV